MLHGSLALMSSGIEHEQNGSTTGCLEAIGKRGPIAMYDSVEPCKIQRAFFPLSLEKLAI